MKAAQIVAPRRIVVVETDEPQLMGAGQVKIQLERACLCGSDVPLWDYDHNELAETARLNPRKAKHVPFVDYVNGDPYPLRVGLSIHECLGTVVESTSDQFQTGDFVLALPDAHTGLSEYICALDSRTIPLPKGAVPDEQILMTQPLGTVVWACQKLGNIVDSDVAIVGQGPMGLMFTHSRSRGSHPRDHQRQNGGSGGRSGRPSDKNAQFMHGTRAPHGHTAVLWRTR